MAGKRRIVFHGPADGAGPRAVAARRMAGRFERHAHQEHLYVLLDRGGRTTDCGGQVLTTPEGAVLCLPAGLAHACRPAGETQDYRAVGLPPELFARLRPQSTPRPAVVRDHDVTEAFGRLFEHIAAKAPKALIEAAAAAFLDLPAARAFERPIEPRAEVHPAVARAAALLRDDPAQTPVLDDLARQAALSPFHLHRLFCRQMGLSPLAFSLRRRVAHARALLDAGADPSEAALAAGFCDQSHLTRHFTRVVGLPPGGYRRGNDE